MGRLRLEQVSSSLEDPAMSHRHLGYCTNVHAGFDLSTTKANLERHAVPIRRQVCPTEPLGIGLWLSNASLTEALAGDEADDFANWLRNHALTPYTLNGFPWGDFHNVVVKHAVYQPTWADPRRLQYTLALIDFLDALLPKGHYGSISTLPIAWGTPAPDQEELADAAAALWRVVDYLEALEQRSGRWICLGLEPEPGCVLQRSGDVVDFFTRFFPSETARRYLGVCHDVCHASVMFERQADVLRAYRAAGIRVAKVQVSSHVRMTLSDSIDPAQRAAAIKQLATFAEDRYLHQTCVSIDGGTPQFFEDLPLALQTIDASVGAQDWRVHFHVPIYVESFGCLQTGREEIRECLREIDLTGDTVHLEVETYAWNVLPESLRPVDLNDGIVKEIQWLRDAVDEGNG
jgi:hypothetical protein